MEVNSYGGFTGVTGGSSGEYSGVSLHETKIVSKNKLKIKPIVFFIFAVLSELL